MSLIQYTLKFLADGQYHSKKEISYFLGISAGLTSKILQQVVELGINLEENEGNYRISGGLELLNKKLILNELGSTRPLLSQLEILTSIDSTNTYLLKRKKTTKTSAVFAEQQTAGRGQFNRRWASSSFAKNIALSILWHFPNEPNKLTGLSLVIGLAVVQALKEYGLKNIKLKWPNDIVYHRKKLAGVLIETYLSKSTACPTIIGIGLNLYPPLINTDFINQAMTDIYSIQKLHPQRNRLAGLLLKNVLTTLLEFQTKGFSAFIKTWNKLDSLKASLICIQTNNGLLEGIAQGINSQGQFCIEIKGKTHCFNSGEIRISANQYSENPNCSKTTI